MSERVRVYELARELGLTNKELITLLEREGVSVKSHSSTLEADVADLIRDLVIVERKNQKSGVAAPAVVEAPVAEADAEEVDDEDAELAALLKEEEEAKKASEESDEEDEGNGNEIHLKTPITVRDLAEGLGKKPNELIGMLFTMNVFAAINQVLDVELVEKICEKCGKVFVRERREKARASAPVRAEAKEAEERPVRKVGRPPVVVFMGHVDHGKTSLQDYIRHTRVTAGESGGITQHIGASVARVGDQTITFLDTPGHEAFTAMRARGANATDVAVLVVAADDGVMPQTIEAINHAKAAGVPIIVAMNKMDKPAADPDKVMLGLQQHGITPEDWGGDTAVIPVSAMTGQGVDDLLERILLEAEMLELAADQNAPFEGLVIEAQMETGRGPTASVLVRNGTLHMGDILICGTCYGKARALIDSQGKNVKRALPSTPIKILGLSGVPEAGERILVCANEREAKELADEAVARQRAESLVVDRATSLEDMFSQLSSSEKPELNIVLKCDVRGSLEAIVESINKIKSEKITAKVIHSGVGEVSENDIVLAAASKAVVMGFHVRVMPGVNRLAKQKGVDVRLYSIIYELLDQVEAAMRGQLKPEVRETPLGEAEIMQVFETSKAGRICGCRVKSGIMRVNAKVKVYREKELIYLGQVQSLRHFKEDVREIQAGNECGIRLDNFEEFEVGDRLELFNVIEVAPEL